eukprot:g67194.t1
MQIFIDISVAIPQHQSLKYSIQSIYILNDVEIAFFEVDPAKVATMAANGSSAPAMAWGPSGDLLLGPSQSLLAHRLNSNGDLVDDPVALDTVGKSDMVQLRLQVYLGHTETLLHGWHNAFTSAQKGAKMKNRAARAAALSQVSVRYRAELENWLQESTESLNQDPSFRALLREKRVSEQDYYDHLCVMETAKSLWHLCEVLYVDPSLNITAQLVDWFQRSEPLPLPSTALSTAQPRPRDPPPDPDWPVVHRLIVQGRVLEAMQRLQSSRQLQMRQRELLQTTLALLQNAPSVTHRQEELTKFVLRFTAWQQHCFKARSQLDAAAQPEWHLLFSLLLGDDNALRDVAQSWSELLVARLLWTKPHMLKEEAKGLALRCVEEFGAEQGELDALKRSALGFTQDPAALLEFLQKVYYSFQQPWFAAHLADLLLQAESVPLDPELVALAQQHRRHYLMEHALELAAHPRLWQLSPTYLLCCGAPGRAALRQTVLSRPVSSSLDGLKLLALCKKHGLEGERREVCRGMAMERVRLKQYGSAVYWFTQAKDEDAVSSTCALVLDQHALGYTDSLESLQSVVDSIADVSISRELAFLAKYHHLHLLRRQRQQKEAQLAALLAGEPDAASGPAAEQGGAEHKQQSQQELRNEIYGYVRSGLEIVVRTIALKVAPRRFWAVLLREAVALLNSADARQPLLSARDTYALMGCLEDLQLAQRLQGVYSPAISPAAEEAKSDKTQAAAGQAKAAPTGDPYKFAGPCTAAFQLSPEELRAVRLGLSRNLSRVR